MLARAHRHVSCSSSSKIKLISSIRILLKNVLVSDSALRCPVYVLRARLEVGKLLISLYIPLL